MSIRSAPVRLAAQFLSALVEREQHQRLSDAAPKTFADFAGLLELIDNCDEFVDTDLLFDYLSLAWMSGPEVVVDLVRSNSQLSVREVYWKHPVFDVCREALDREIQTMKPIKPTEEGMYQCSKCGSKQTSVVKAQTRSADEGMTDFVTCHNCGKKWKVNN